MTEVFRSAGQRVREDRLCCVAMNCEGAVRQCVRFGFSVYLQDPSSTVARVIVFVSHRIASIPLEILQAMVARLNVRRPFYRQILGHFHLLMQFDVA